MDGGTKIPNWRREAEKQRILDELYAASGRDNGLYTGLWLEHLESKKSAQVENEERS